MKILHISSESSWRGGEQQLAYLLEELQKIGVELLVACQKNSAFETYCQKKNIVHFGLPFRNSLDIGSAFQLKQICQRENISIMHAHSSRGHSIAYLAHLFGASLPLLLTRRVAFPISPTTLNNLRYNSSQLQKIICVSKAVKESTAPIIQHKDKLELVYDGIDLKRFENIHLPQHSIQQELNLPAATPLIGIVAALTVEKDLNTFIRVAGELSATLPQAHFVVIGDGPEKSALEVLTAQLKLEGKMHFLGRRNNIPQLIQQLSLFLFTSSMEGLGTSVLDAFACKVPVVATAAGGVPEMVQHEKTGLLAAIGDVKSLATSVLRVFKNNALREKITNNAYDLLIKQFTKEEMATQTARVYREVLAKRHKIAT